MRSSNSFLIALLITGIYAMSRADLASKGGVLEEIAKWEPFAADTTATMTCKAAGMLLRKSIRFIAVMWLHH